MPAISVIVPVYKVEQYLRQCIDSILAQSFIDFELLLIDDGSPDNSGKICDEYAAKDRRVRVFHKENGGVSTARNYGLDKAEGNWVTFVDSDDWISDGYLQNFIAEINFDDVLVVQDIYKVKDNKVTRLLDCPVKTVSLNQANELLVDYKLLINGYPFAKLYNLKTIRAHHLKFLEDVHLAEDLLFFLKYLKFCSGIKFTNYINYYYLMREGSLSVKYNSFESESLCFFIFKNSIQDLFGVCKLSKLAETKINEALGSILSRSINTLYIFGQKQVQTRRVQSLKSLWSLENVIYYRAWNTSIIRKPLAFLFKARYFYLLDFVLALIFRFRNKSY